MSAIGTTAQLTPAQLIQQLLGQLELDVVTGAGGLLATALTNIQANPTVQNAAAQGAILTASALVAGPSLEPVAIKQVATSGLLLLSWAQAAAASAIAKGQAGAAVVTPPTS